MFEVNLDMMCYMADIWVLAGEIRRLYLKGLPANIFSVFSGRLRRSGLMGVWYAC